VACSGQRPPRRLAGRRQGLLRRAGAETEEELRLLHFAMTRAKHSLPLIVPQRFFAHGQSPHGDATSMPPGHASSRRPCWIFTNARVGQRPPPAGQRQDPRKIRTDIGECGACGTDRPAAEATPALSPWRAAETSWRSRPFVAALEPCWLYKRPPAWPATPRAGGITRPDAQRLAEVDGPSAKLWRQHAVTCGRTAVARATPPGPDTWE
jgi:ATP-dependent exoDNAse (exonuclease V) beta subunit